MKRAGKMWILDDDTFFNGVFAKSGDGFELEHLNTALTYVKDKRVAIDGGANYGSWSRHLARNFGKVISFEPVDNIHECLEKNISDYPNIELHKNAIGNEERNVNVGIGKAFYNHGCYTVTGDGDMKMITIDSLNLETLDFLKLDLEGFEYFALKGAEETLKRCKPVVLFEENSRGKLEHDIDNGMCGKYLESLGAKHLITLKGRDLIYGWE